MTASLRSTQTWFHLATTHAGDLEAGISAASRTCGSNEGCDLETLIKGGHQLSAFERLAIYHDGYKGRLVECLADDFPALKYALGNERFEELALRYIAEHPSESTTLNAYGRHMAALCLRTEFSERTFLAELARLEWALVEAVHAELTRPLTPEVLEGLSPDLFARARFIPGATLRLLHFKYPVNDYYNAFRQELAPGIPECSASCVAVYRRDFTLWRRDLNPPAALLLEALCSGETLGRAVSSLDASPDVNAADVMRWFRDWITDGLFSAIVTE